MEQEASAGENDFPPGFEMVATVANSGFPNDILGVFLADLYLSAKISLVPYFEKLLEEEVRKLVDVPREVKLLEVKDSNLFLR